MDPITVLTAFAPVVVDGVKTLINRFAPDQLRPANVDEYVKMKQVDMQLLQAINDNGGATSYPQVEAVVRLMRPTIGLLVLLTWVYSVTVGVPSDAINNFALLFKEEVLRYLLATLEASFTFNLDSQDSCDLGA